VAETFDSFVVARGPGLLRFAYVLCGDRHLAEDLVQEVLARVHRKWSRIEELTYPEAYVRKAVVREFLSWRRRLSNRELVAAYLPERTQDAPDPAARQAVFDELWRLLATLPRAQRAVLVLRFFEDLPDARIAELLDCTAATVRVHASRGLARLRASMGPANTAASTGVPL